MKLKETSITMSFALLLQACAVGEDYVKPELKLPEHWAAPALKDTDLVKESEEAKAVTENWWEKFADPSMNKLIERASAENYDMKIAQMRILEAQAAEGVTNSRYYPQIDGVAGITREKLNDINGRASTFKQAGINGRWDLDIFGQNRRRNEAADANIDATAATSESVRQQVIAETARNYIIFRGLQQQFLITEKNMEFQGQTLKIADEQRKAGAASDLDISRANAQVRSTAARLPQIRTALYASVTRLMTLTNQSYDEVYAMLHADMPIPSITEKEVMAMPLETVRARPDVIAAERQLAEAAALKEAAFAGYFPKLSLEGFIGVSHSSLFGSSSPWTASANALLPLINFGRISSEVDAADAQKMQAFYNYKQVVLLALEDTENAITAYVNEVKRAEELAAVAKSQEKAASIAREQYNVGVATQLDLLTAERGLLDAQSELASSKARIAENLVLLYRALGR